MVFSIFKRWRRRRLTQDPFPEAWLDVLRRNVRQYRHLDGRQCEKIQTCTQVMVAEKFWEGTSGFQITDEIKVTIAGTASLLLLGLPRPYYFDHLNTILIHPDLIRTKLPIGSARIVDEDEVYSGQAWQGGPLVFSWPDVLWHREGHNVVLHEFAHHIDGLDGEMGGIPPVRDPEKLDRWRRTVKQEHHKLTALVQAGKSTPIDPYAAASHAELFAVCSEYFFEKPRVLIDHLPAMYSLLQDFYQVDPTKW